MPALVLKPGAPACTYCAELGVVVSAAALRPYRGVTSP